MLKSHRESRPDFEPSTRDEMSDRFRSRGRSEISGCLPPLRCIRETNPRTDDPNGSRIHYVRVLGIVARATCEKLREFRFFVSRSAKFTKLSVVRLTRADLCLNLTRIIRFDIPETEVAAWVKSILSARNPIETRGRLIRVGPLLSGTRGLARGDA